MRRKMKLLTIMTALILMINMVSVSAAVDTPPEKVKIDIVEIIGEETPAIEVTATEDGSDVTATIELVSGAAQWNVKAATVIINGVSVSVKAPTPGDTLVVVKSFEDLGLSKGDTDIVGTCEAELISEEKTEIEEKSIVSNTTVLVRSEESFYAPASEYKNAELAWKHANWQPLNVYGDPRPQWIWNAYHVEHPEVREELEFLHEFTIDGEITGPARLAVGVDNGFAASVNGTEVLSGSMSDGRIAWWVRDGVDFLNEGQNTLVVSAYNGEPGWTMNIEEPYYIEIIEDAFYGTQVMNEDGTFTDNSGVSYETVYHKGENPDGETFYGYHYDKKVGGTVYEGHTYAQALVIDQENNPAGLNYKLTYSTKDYATMMVNGLFVFDIEPEEEEPNPTPTPKYYDLVVSATEGGTVPGLLGTNTFASGTSVLLDPVAEEGYEFTGWSGSVAGNTVVLTSDKSVTANFALIEEEIIEEEIPEEAPVVVVEEEEEVVEEEILDEETPENVEMTDEELPEAGGLPLEVISLAGMAVMGLGVKIRKRR